MLDSHVVSTEVKNDEQINVLQVDLIPNLEAIGAVFRTKHPGNGAVAFHDDGRVCAIGGWDGRCVPLPTNTPHDRLSSFLKKKKPVAIKKKFRRKN